MIRFARTLSAAAAVALLAGCPAFFYDRGEMVVPSASADRPAVRSLPRPDQYVELAPRWRREVRLGLGGFASATLWDPRLAMASLAHDAALQNLRGGQLESLITNQWASWYGEERDRFPIDLNWRFDEQFITKAQILDPSQWTIRLITSDGRSYAPIAVTTLSSQARPVDGYWEATVRLWFPWRDPYGKGPIMGGGNSAVRLSLEHPSGSGDMTWRFGTAY